MQLRPAHTRELAPATRSRNMLLEQSSLVCINDFMRKTLSRNKIFAPGFCAIESNTLEYQRNPKIMVAFS